jgi:hypothetical protein
VRDASGRFLPGHTVRPPSIPRVTPPPGRLKQCTGPCGKWFPIECFTKDPTSPDGRERRCKACRYERRRELKKGARRRRPWAIRNESS